MTMNPGGMVPDITGQNMHQGLDINNLLHNQYMAHRKKPDLKKDVDQFINHGQMRGRSNSTDRPLLKVDS